MNRTSSLMQAAVVLTTLPKSQAAKVLARLEPADVKTVLDAITRLDQVTAEQISTALDRFSAESERWRLGDDATDGSALVDARAQIENALAKPMSRMEQAVDSEKPFAFLLDAIPMIRAHLLADEHPKNVAIVLSTLPPEVASQTMENLDPTQRISVLKRMCEIEELNESDVAELSFAIKLRFKRLLSARHSSTPGVGIAANLLSCSDQRTRETLLTHVSQTDPDLAFKLQRSVFKLERLETLDDREIKIVLKHVDTSCWAPALKNAGGCLVEKIMNNMADGPTELLRHEIAEFGFVDPETEDKARQHITHVVLRLAREGKIDFRKRGPRDTKPLVPTLDQAISTEPTSVIN